MITHVVEPSEWDAEVVEIQGDAYRHLFRARRLAKGEWIRLVDGTGRASRAEIVEIDRKTARLCPGELLPSGEPKNHVELIVGTPKNERASWLVEKATEIGVHAVRFLSTQRSPRSYGDNVLARLRRVAVAAVEQCHRARVPEITGVHSWSELPDLIEALPARWFFDTAADTAAGTAADTAADTAAGTVADGSVLLPQEEPAVVLIGPEGGWGDPEREEIRHLGGRPVSLGPRVLRVETAATAAAARLLLF